MIIDTKKLRSMVNGLDDVLYPDCNWDTCSMDFLNRREAIAVKSFALIDEIEILAENINDAYLSTENA